MEADRGEPGCGDPAEPFDPDFEVTPHEYGFDPRQCKRIVEVARAGHVREIGEAGEGGPELMLGMALDGAGPGVFLGPISQDQEVHRFECIRFGTFWFAAFGLFVLIIAKAPRG